MSKIIWVFSKKEIDQDICNKIKAICEQLAPDNITPNPPKIKIDSNLVYGIINPKNTIEYFGNSVALGLIFETGQKWYIPKENYPDGSYALFRDNFEYSEIISDPSGSRTIWYYFDDNHLIASTSQIAIIKFIKNYSFNLDVIPWMLSTGTLGPDNSWDSRIKKLLPDSSILLNKNSWILEIKTNEVVYKKRNGEANFHKKKLQDSINQTFGSLKVDLNKWTLPLSGGYDSRAILFFLNSNNFSPINCITWGLSEAIKDKESDAGVAKDLAESLNVNHRYFETDFSNEPIEIIVDRFIKNGEGRIDHISGYLDGFAIWKELHEQNIQGIIRGDENFGWHEIDDKSEVLQSVGIKFFREFDNLVGLIKNLGLSQNIPNYLDKKNGETNSQWRDRLYHQFRLQSMVSALSDLKLCYIEQISPLLSRKIIETVRQIPDKYRTNKSIFKSLIEDYNSTIRFATKESIATSQGLIHSEKFCEYLKKELSEIDNSEIFPKVFINDLINNLTYSNKTITNTKETSWKKILKKLIPKKIFRLAKNNIKIKKEIDYNKLAFRVIIILKMNSILRE